MAIDPTIPMSSPNLTEADLAAVAAVLGTRHLALGPKAPEFESAVAGYVKARHGVAINSGTAGLHLAISCGVISGWL